GHSQSAAVFIGFFLTRKKGRGPAENRGHEGDTRLARGSQTDRDARNDFKGNACLAERLRLFPALGAQKGIASEEAHHAPSLACGLNHGLSTRLPIPWINALDLLA